MLGSKFWPIFKSLKFHNLIIVMLQTFAHEWLNDPTSYILVEDRYNYGSFTLICVKYANMEGFCRQSHITRVT